MKGLASSNLHGVRATPVQLQACSTMSIRRGFCALPDIRGVERKRLSLWALRKIHHVAPALPAWPPASPPRCRMYVEFDQCKVRVVPLDQRALPFDEQNSPCLLESRRQRGRPVALAGASFDPSPATALVLTSALGFVLLRTFIYFRMEYIIAAMVGRHVPREGARVVELNIREGRNLYYYPSDTVQVVAVSTNPNRALLENQAVKAGVPIQIKTRRPSSLGIPGNSVDAVVSVYAFHNLSDGEVKNVLGEAVKVLQPGKPFIFVESVGAKNPVVRAAQNTLQNLLKLAGSKTTLTRDLLQYIQEVDELEDLEYEEIFDLFDPQLVGVAKKKLTVGSASHDSPSVKRGFKKSKS